MTIPQRVTDRAVHHIRLKLDTKSVYIPAYRLPQGQKTIVDNIVNDMLEQVVIQESGSPVIDFRRARSGQGVMPCYWYHVTQYNQLHGRVVGD